MENTLKNPKEIEFEDFKAKYFSFIKENLGVDLVNPSFPYSVRHFFSHSKGGSIIVCCNEQNKFFDIIRLLEKDDFYKKRLEMENGDLKINQYEKFETPEKVILLKNFFCKLEELLPNSFRINAPATVLVGGLNEDGFVRINLTFFKTYMIDRFISIIPDGWNCEVFDLRKVILNLELVDINDFMSNKLPIFTNRDEDERLGIKNEHEPIKVNGHHDPDVEKTGLGYLNPDLSFLENLHEPKPVEKPKLVDVDIGLIPNPKPEIVIREKTTKPVKILKSIKTKKDKKIMKNSKMLEIVQNRKKFAQYFVEALKTAFTPFASKIKIETGRFTYAAAGFSLSVPREAFQDIKKYFDNKKVDYKISSDSSFTIIYSTEQSPEIDSIGSKGLINLCGKERETILRVLANKGYNHRNGGRGKRIPGVFSISRSDGMASSLMMNLDILNKKTDTLNQVFKIVKDYYSNHEKSSLVTVEKNDENLNIKVVFSPDFFVVKKDEIKDEEQTAELDVKPEVRPVEQQPEPVAENPKSDADDSEIETIIEIAHEEEASLDAEIKKLQAQKESKRNEFLLSIADALSGSFLGIINEMQIKVFALTKDNDNLQTFSEFSETQLRELIFLSMENLTKK